ncbi:MAG: hypothetical protein KF688_10305 [Pirellulales bacterium]|nr:hypothetical protein [Pirellulales bacterium]
MPNVLGANVLRAGTPIAGRLILLAKLAAGEQNSRPVAGRRGSFSTRDGVVGDGESRGWQDLFYAMRRPIF